MTPGEIAKTISRVGGFMPPTGATLVPGTTEQRRPPPDDPQRKACESWLDTAIAVCLAESGGNPNAANPSSNARGLWQIMTTVHTDKIAEAVAYWSGELGKPVDILDPLVNTQVASWVYQDAGKRWTPWEVYNNAQYINHRGHGKAAYRAVTSKKFFSEQATAFEANQISDSTYTDIAQTINPVGVAQAAVTKFPEWIRPVTDFLKQAGTVVGAFILGAILVILGAWFLLSRGGVSVPTNPAKAAAKAAKGLTKK